MAAFSTAVRMMSGVLLAAALAAPAAAQETSTQMPGLAINNDQPIQIESDKLEIKEQEGRAIFTGNVKVVQGDTTMQSGLMHVYYRSGAASGGVVASGASDIDRIEVTDTVLIRTATQTATADRGSFHMGDEVAVLEGDKVVLTEGENIFIGCKLTVRMRSGEAKLESCGSGRVRIQLDPKSRPSQ